MSRPEPAGPIPPKPAGPRHERRILFLILLGGLPAILTAVLLLLLGDFSAKVRWTFSTLAILSWAGLALAARERVVRPLQVISNLLAALREGDFSIRARGSGPGDALGEVLLEVNTLAETLRRQRLGALEASALLRKVMAEIEVAVFAFDGAERLRLVNQAGERLLGRPGERLLGRGAAELGLSQPLHPEAPRVIDLSFPGRTGRFEVRRRAFRQGGLTHHLLVISDLSLALRAEERQAWQRLIRVIGHELNNSLAPIKSIAGSLEDLLDREPLPDDWRIDARQGLKIVETRAESLARFMEGYARLARLPSPTRRDLEVGALARRVASLETRQPVALLPGPALTIRADGDQLEQLLINLIRNAVDAAQETGGGVRLGWSRHEGEPALLELYVEDDGPGLPSPANLFVPFFTTKQHGSGIGLVLSRQIAEAHGGTLTLENRAPGCRARLRIPLG